MGAEDDRDDALHAAHWEGRYQACSDRLTTAQARIEALEGERDAAVASRMSDHGILLDAWRDRGEAVPGVDRESTVLRVIRGIHAMRDRAEQAETALTAARTRAEGLEGAMAEARAALHTEGWMRHVPAIVCAVGCIDRALTPPPATTGEEPLAKRWAHPNGPYEGCGCDYDGWGTRLRACAEHRAKEPTR